MKVIVKKLTEDLNKKIDNLILQALYNKGYEFKSRIELESFIKERCRVEDKPHIKEKTYFVDDTPFLLHKYSNEDKTWISNNGSTINATAGEFSSL